MRKQFLDEACYVNGGDKAENPYPDPISLRIGGVPLAHGRTSTRLASGAVKAHVGPFTVRTRNQCGSH
jgi:hypothetical protein